MAIDTGSLYYLVDPFLQIENVNGKPIVGGHVEVFEAGTDNKIITYADWDGTRHPFKIPLGSDGRAVILVDPGYRYDAYVYDSFNNLVCSRLNIIPLSDGDITIDGMGQVYHDETLSGKGTPNSPLTVISGGKVYGGIYPIDVNNELDMISADNVPLGVQSPLYFAQDDDEGLVIALSSVPVPEGTMNESAFGYQDGQITSYNGSAFSAGNSYEAGNYISIDNNTLSVTGLTPVPADTASTGLVASVSADITAMIPDTSDMATQTWVNEQGFLTAHQDLSDYAKTEDLTAYQEKGDYYSASNPDGFINSDAISAMATTGFVAGVSADITAMIPDTSDMATKTWVSSQGYLTAHQSLDGLMSADLLEISDNKITGYNGTAFAGQGGVSGDFTLVEGNGIQLTDDPTAQTTTISVSGDYATNTQLQTVSADITAMIPTALTGDYLDKASADTLYYPLNSNPNNYLTGLPADVVYTADIADMATTDDLTGKQDITGMTAYATVESLTAKQDAGDYISATDSANFLLTSDSGNFYPMNENPSGYLTAHQSLADYQLTADMTGYLTTSDSANFLTAVPDTYLQNTDLTISDGKITEISGVPLSAGDELPSGLMNESALEYNAVNEISGYNGSAIAQYGAEKQWLVHDDTLVHASNSAQYALGVAIDNVARLLHIDETVLWSGNTFSIGDGSRLSATVQLSEPISAFEEIKIISSGNLDSETIILDTSKRGNNGAFTWIVPEGLNSVWVGLRGVFTDQTHLKVYGGYSTSLASVFTGNGWWSYKNIYKVVGIGRKQ